MGGKEEFLKIQTCVLKVNIHCDGCKHKVKKILQKIDGVYTIKIDSEQGKVTVSGNIDPSKIITKLIKNGKHAELWGASKANPQNFQNQFKNLQIDNGKGGNNNNKGNAQKGKGGGGGGNNNQPKGGLAPMNPQLQQLQMMKALQDMKMAPKGQQNNQKSVKFDLAEDDGFSDDEFDDDWDDEDDDDYYDDELDEGPLNKMKAMMGSGQGGAQMANILQMQNMMNAKKGGGGGGNIPLQMNHGGNGAGGGKKGGNENNNGGNHNQGGAKGGKNGGGNSDHGQDKNGNNSHNFNPNGAKKGGGGMNNGPQGMMTPNMMAAMNKQGNPPMGHMNNLPPVRGMPMAAGGGGGAGHFQGDQMPQGGNPFLQQQQLAAMMMNQQRANGNERSQPMMYARPPPAVNYMPPHPSYQYPYPPPPGTRLDDYAMFSDENTSSCSVM